MSNMHKKLSNIDFSFYIGQKVTNVHTKKDETFAIVFEKASLMIECPWKLIVSDEIVIGCTDCDQSTANHPYKKVKTILMEKRILNIYHYEGISDLMVEFEGTIYLELFHASSQYEGWQLHAENGDCLVSLPGGDYAEFV